MWWLLAYLQLWGAASGGWQLVVVLPAIPRQAPSIAVWLALLFFYSASGFAGLSVLRHRKVGRALTIAVQALQILSVQTATVVFILASGVSVVVGTLDGPFGFTFGLWSRGLIFWGDLNVRPAWGVNVLALGAFIFALLTRPVQGASPAVIGGFDSN